MLWVSKMFVIPDQLWMLITILSQLEDTEHFRCTANFNKCLHCWTFVFVELFSNYFKSTVFKQKLNQPTLRPNTMMVDGWHPAIRSYYWGCVPGGKHHWTMIGLLMEKDQQGEKIGTTRGCKPLLHPILLVGFLVANYNHNYRCVYLITGKNGFLLSAKFNWHNSGRFPIHLFVLSNHLHTKSHPLDTKTAFLSTSRKSAKMPSSKHGHLVCRVPNHPSWS